MKKIKSIKSFVLSAEAPEPVMTAYEERSPENLVIREDSYYLDGSLNHSVIRKLDDKGVLAEELQFSQEDEPDQHSFFAYDNAGKPATVKTRYRDGSHSIKTYQRDEAGNSETATVVDDDEMMESKIYRRYDSEGNILEEISYGEEGVLMQKTNIAYDDHARPVSTVIEYNDGYVKELFYEHALNDKAYVETLEITDGNGRLVRLDQFVYNDKGTKTEHHIQDADQGVSVIYKWEHDDNDRVVSQYTLRTNGEIIEEKHSVYGAHGLVEKQEVVNNQGQIVEHSYTYEFHD